MFFNPQSTNPQKLDLTLQLAYIDRYICQLHILLSNVFSMEDRARVNYVLAMSEEYQKKLIIYNE